LVAIKSIIIDIYKLSDIGKLCLIVFDDIANIKSKITWEFYDDHG